MMTFFTDVLVEKEGPGCPSRIKLTPIMPQDVTDTTVAAAWTSLESIKGAYCIDPPNPENSKAL